MPPLRGARSGIETDLITPEQLVQERGTPDTIRGWKALAQGLLTDQPCVFHRNMGISSRYAAGTS